MIGFSATSARSRSTHVLSVMCAEVGVGSSSKVGRSGKKIEKGKLSSDANWQYIDRVRLFF